MFDTNNPEAMQIAFSSLVNNQTADWKPEYKQILWNTVVDVIKEKDHLRVVVRPAATGPKADQIKEYLLKVLFEMLVNVAGGHKCRVRKFE